MQINVILKLCLMCYADKLQTHRNLISLIIILLYNHSFNNLLNSLDTFNLVNNLNTQLYSINVLITFIRHE